MEGRPAHSPAHRSRGSRGPVRRPRAGPRAPRALSSRPLKTPPPDPKATGPYSREGREYFAKVVEAPEVARLDAEDEGLQALREAGEIRVPLVLGRGANGTHAWLLLERLELEDLGPPSAARLGIALAAQHRQPRDRFGWATDNFIGLSPQANEWSEDWLAFWRAKRLHPQLRMAAARRLPSRMIDRGERLSDDCPALFSCHVPSRSLLHGDLWGGNASALSDGTPVVFDPSVYVGDAEADLAMTELFGGFPADFRDAYRNARPLTAGYPVRRDFYNLYHVLNHANLFGGGYVRQAEVAIERLLAEIR